MSEELKRGKFSLEELAYIDQNRFDLTAEEIATTLGRSVEVIRRRIYQMAIETPVSEELFVILRGKNYYREIKKQFTSEELVFFELQWMDYYNQFNQDVTHTEEMQMVELIRTEILINRAMKIRMDSEGAIASLTKLINVELSRPKDQQDINAISIYQQQIGSIMGAQSASISEHDKLVTKKEKYLREIKGTREQRKKVADDAKQNFTMWLKLIDNLAVQEIEGHNIAVHAKAAEKAKERLSELHEYEDGEVDYPILNHETLKKHEERTE